MPKTGIAKPTEGGVRAQGANPIGTCANAQTMMASLGRSPFASSAFANGLPGEAGGVDLHSKEETGDRHSDE